MTKDRFPLDECMSKKVFADKLKISYSTLRNWLNERYFSEIEKFGYRKTDRILVPGVIKFILRKVGHLDSDPDTLAGKPNKTTLF